MLGENKMEDVFLEDMLYDTKSYIDLFAKVDNEVEPFDPAYPAVLLSNGLKNRVNEAKTAIGEIYRFVEKQLPIAPQIKQAMQNGCRYVVDMSDEMIKGIDNGIIKLTQENGNTYAQLRNGSYYGKKLPIKRELFRKGIDPVQMGNSLQMQALREQLETITEQINVISYNVKEVLQGQQNDRIGLYYSGMSLYLEARNITNPEMKQALIAQAIRALSDAAFQLKLEMRSDIEYLENKGYKSEKGKSAVALEEHMQKINQSFAFIHQAMMLKAGIYCDQGQLAAMSTVLEEYSHFIEDVVVKNVKLLSSCDKSDDGTNKGLWSSRANLKLEVSEFAKKLNESNKTLYLGIEEEK